MFEIANVSHSSDDIAIINETVLGKIVKGYQNISEGGRFIVKRKEKLELFFCSDLNDNTEALCDVPIKLYIHGDLKIFAQVLGRDGMSSSWCMWCDLHPSEWRSLYQQRNGQNVGMHELWTMEKQKSYIQKINSKELKGPKQKKGIVSDPIIPFIEPEDYIFPLLHFEIGAVNNVLDNLRNFVEDQVEIISEAEKVGRNCVITADVACTRAKEILEEFSENGAAVDVRFLRLQKVEVNQALKQRGLTEQQIASLVADRRQIDDRIAQIMDQKKNLEKELGRKRKA